ncbi:hypothetical protein ACSBR2_037394 [Camellia fascicularis]
MMKKGQVAGFIGAASFVRHAKAAPLVCVLDVKYVVFQTAAAKLALTSPGMQKLEYSLHTAPSNIYRKLQSSSLSFSN